MTPYLQTSRFKELHNIFTHKIQCVKIICLLDNFNDYFCAKLLKYTLWLDFPLKLLYKHSSARWCQNYKTMKMILFYSDYTLNINIFMDRFRFHQ